MPSTVLARRVGVANNTIWRIEAGRRTPSLELLEKVARHLRTEPAELLREPAPAGKGEASREAGPEEREEADLRTWRHLLSSVLDSTAESGGEIPTALQALVARRLLEELSRTIGTAPEAREVQERLRAVRHQLAALVHQGSHTPLSSEQESALKVAHKLLAALLEPSLAGPEEERRSAEADRWIDYLNEVTDRWLPQLWRALPLLEEGLPLEEVRRISVEATALARLYIERRGVVRRGCSAEQREALDNLEEALERVLNLSSTQFEELFQQRQHEQQGIPDLAEMRKEQEERKATAAVFHHVRHRETSA